MTEHSDFVKAIDVQIVRWRFEQMIVREFGHIGGSNLLAVDVPAPTDDTAPAVKGRGGSETGAR